MEIREYLENNFEQFKAALDRLVRIPSVSGEAEGQYPFGKSCGEVLDEFLKICEENGFHTRNYDYFAGSAEPCDGTVLYENIEPELGILAHLDVVPVTEKDWTFPPFEVTEREGFLYGRGVTDDKGPLLAALFAMKAVRECGYRLQKNVRLIAGCSEETGDERDIEEYCKRAKMPPMVFTPDADFPIITTEKGLMRFSFRGSFDCEKIVSIKGGTVVNAVPSEVTAVIEGDVKLEGDGITSEYKNGRTELVCKGVSAHASMPEQGENAFTKLFTALTDCNLPENDRKMLGALLRLFPHGETNGAALELDCTDVSGSTTCVFSIIDFEGGRLSCKADMRFPVSFSKAAVVEKFRSAVEKAGLEFVSATGSEPHTVDTEGDFVKTLLEVYGEVTGLPAYCKAIGGGTYVHGIEGGVAFGPECEGEDNRIHGADERAKISSLLTSAEIYAKAIIRLCGGMR